MLKRYTKKKKDTIKFEEIKIEEEDEKDDLRFKNVNFLNSSKMEALFRSLKNMKKTYPNDKCVIFSQFTMYLDLIEEKIIQSDFIYTRLDGRLSRDERVSVLHSFNNDPEITILLCSLRVGGVGLNLTIANHVYLLEPWWNPAVDQQAIDRVHRIGQCKPVFVTRFYCKDTIEIKILTLQKYKLGLSQYALGQDTTVEIQKFNRFSIDELTHLFSSKGDDATPLLQTDESFTLVPRPLFSRQELDPFPQTQTQTPPQTQTQPQIPLLSQTQTQPQIPTQTLSTPTQTQTKTETPTQTQTKTDMLL